MRRELAIALLAGVMTFGVPARSAARALDPVGLESTSTEDADVPTLWDLIGLVGVGALLRRHIEHETHHHVELGRRTARHS